MVDFSALGQGDVGGFLFGGNDPSGLLTQPQQKDINQQGMLGLAAGLLQAGGPSPYKGSMRFGSDLGSGLAAGLKARDTAQTQLLNQSLVRAKTLEGMTPLLKLEQDIKESGETMSPTLQRTLQQLHGVTGVGGGQVLPGVGGSPGPGLLGQLGQMFGISPMPGAGGTLPPAMPGQGGVPGVPDVGAKPPPTNVMQKFADDYGFSRAAIRKDGPGHEAFMAAFNETRDARAEGMSPAEYNAYKTNILPEYAKQMAAASETGAKSHETSNILNQMEDALRAGGRNISTGPTADIMLKLKQLAANFNWDIAGTSEAESIKKLNAFLAAAASKQISARPAMFEYKSMIQNNPGLETSPQGTLTLLSILRQSNAIEAKLGDLAGDPKNLRKWPKLRSEFYSNPENFPKSPRTGKPLNPADYPAVPEPLAPPQQPPQQITGTSKGGIPFSYPGMSGAP
jgi:hypothetical protein